MSSIGNSEKWKMNVIVAQSCLTLRPHGLYSPWNSPGQNTGLGSLSLLQGIFPTQGWNPGLLHCRRILYQLSPEGSPLGTLDLSKGLSSEVCCYIRLIQKLSQGSQETANKSEEEHFSFIRLFEILQLVYGILGV